jgi:hypothetical protein
MRMTTADELLLAVTTAGGISRLATYKQHMRTHNLTQHHYDIMAEDVYGEVKLSLCLTN